MERRFIIWRQDESTALQPLHYNSNPQPPPRPNSGTTGGLFNIVTSWVRAPFRSNSSTITTATGSGDQNTHQDKDTHAGHAVPGSGAMGPGGSSVLPRWIDGLMGIWNTFTSSLGSKQYGGINLESTADTVSCALNVSEVYKADII